jgi:hypothetical protein
VRLVSLSSFFEAYVLCSRTGQAIILAPSGFGVFEETHGDHTTRSIDQFGRRYILMKTRKRVTADGGASVLAVNAAEERSYFG